MKSHQSESFCPQCNEPVKKSWRICPECEHPLQSETCYGCGMAVKSNWKRCPACEVKLKCDVCNSRINVSGCPLCQVQSPDKIPTLIEPATGMEFFLVPGGTFDMGDLFDEGIDNEKPIHRVELASFYMAKFPATQAQWSSLMPGNPSSFKNDQNPVEQVSLNNVNAFVETLTRKNNNRYFFRLPTETEWEYAARSGGQDERFAGSQDVNEVAWYEDNSGGATRAVGQKKPNSLGLSDMSGNIWEWCLDTYQDDAYQQHALHNPCCTKQGRDKVIRGGGWNVDAWSVRCARRIGFSTDYLGPALGFRLVIQITDP